MGLLSPNYKGPVLFEAVEQSGAKMDNWLPSIECYVWVVGKVVYSANRKKKKKQAGAELGQAQSN